MEGRELDGEKLSVGLEKLDPVVKTGPKPCRFGVGDGLL